MLDRSKTAQLFQCIEIDGPVVDLVSPLAQEIADHVLTRPLRAARRGDRDEIPRHGKLRVERVIHRAQNSPLNVGNCHHFHLLAVTWITALLERLMTNCTDIAR